MPSDPYIFDEDWAEASDVETDALDVVGAYCHINDHYLDRAQQTYQRTEIQQKESDFLASELDAEWKYSAMVALNSTTMRNSDHPRDGEELIRLCIGQDNELQYDGRYDVEGENTEVISSLDSFSESWAYLTPDQAREVASLLLNWADKVSSE